MSIPGSVQEIDGNAFQDCTSLVSATIGSGVTEISVEIFRGCTALRSVVIPRGVKKIDDGAFSGCTSLVSVLIPRSVTEICITAFQGCGSKSRVQYDGTKAQWGAISKGQYRYPTIGNFTVQCTDVVVTEK